MKGMNLAAVCVFVILWVLLTVHPKDDHDKAFNERYINTITEYNNHRYEAYNGPKTVLEEADAPYACEFTDEEITLIARVVMSEASRECFEVKQAIAETVINRLKSDYKEFRYQNTLEDVVYADSQWAYNQEPSDECFEATMAAIMYNAFPDDMLWARKDYVIYGHEICVNKDSVVKFSTVTNYYAEVDE